MSSKQDEKKPGFTQSLQNTPHLAQMFPEQT